ncbi:aryl-alcohol dehydrogenase-like predicted oxidoreductase [Streptomyces griseochromogenes]|uniref:Aldo/keto reductase n=1 Tax=Streptomyces griseochromogenes TaxID=68214 RepID=A0A1B1B8Y6_9ACTN|nr:aldo/keto reductase [Streptomyces griseochromogenes]ANP55298.1 aldo/keto reductase [Streptomyces griseochromogenes]MBP2050253.1 aryl-alcohol dehydrogenase-like predicted oxidoreductase [Streptomyces griseochromogenes]
MTTPHLTTRALGGTGMDITRVGFGSWAVSGSGWRFGWGATDDAESIAAIRHAIDAGVNWIDTAAAYGLGHSEELVGKAVAQLPEADRPYLFTKVGLVWDPDNPQAAPRRTMKPASVRREIEDSLRRLGVERIDLYQVHWPDTGESLQYAGDGSGAVSPNATPLEEYWQVMADLKAEGKVRAIGLSNHSPEQLAAAERIAHVDVVQPPFSAINRSAADEIAWAHAHDTGVIVYSPLQSGLLTGAFSAERVANLPADDWRAAHQDFTTGLDANLQVADALRPVADRHGATVAEVAIAWALAWPGITGAIVGARKPGQVDGWIGAGSVEPTPADLEEIAAAISTSGAGTGPVRP